MDARLLDAIGKPKIQSQAGELVRLALAALDDLKQLDESLYERFVASREAPQDRVTSASGLRRLWNQTFRGMDELLAYCRTIASEREAPARPPSGSDAFADVNWGELDGNAAPPADGESHALDLGSSDIGDLLDGIDEHVEEGDSERWAKVVEGAVSIEYGLRTQLVEAGARVEAALANGETGQVLGLLDDTQSTTSEGVHALVSAVYGAFLPDVNPGSVVPGYLTSLARALLVRRGLAELASVLTPQNDVLQGGDARRHLVALGAIRAKLHEFVTSVVCRAMRPADRWQIVEMERALAGEPLGAARQTSEGLVKYLDSLRSINQREVLVIHDRAAIDDMRESLASARELVDISPRTAHEMIDRSHEAAQRLLGRHPATDQMVAELEWYVPATGTRAETLTFLERLEAVLVASGG